jgi:hypothetical protein
MTLILLPREQQAQTVLLIKYYKIAFFYFEISRPGSFCTTLGTTRNTQTKLSRNKMAVSANTHRIPTTAASEPPENGPRKLPMNAADAVNP